MYVCGVAEEMSRGGGLKEGEGFLRCESVCDGARAGRRQWWQRRCPLGVGGALHRRQSGWETESCRLQKEKEGRKEERRKEKLAETRKKERKRAIVGFPFLIPLLDQPIQASPHAHRISPTVASLRFPSRPWQLRSIRPTPHARNTESR